LYLHELVLENIVPLRSHARAKQIDLCHSIHTDTYVYTDYVSISTILHNLLVNALWFTHNGGKVDISAKPVDRFVQVTVSDTGIGITPEDLPKLFRIDQKFRRPGTAGEHGTGLGLVLCKDLVEIGGGQIWVESAVDRGSSFMFTLPTQQSSL
jgi:two-component system, sensor histidine kinase and response regulator